MSGGPSEPRASTSAKNPTSDAGVQTARNRVGASLALRYVCNAPPATPTASPGPTAVQPSPVSTSSSPSSTTNVSASSWVCGGGPPPGRDVTSTTAIAPSVAS